MGEMLYRSVIAVILMGAVQAESLPSPRHQRWQTLKNLAEGLLDAPQMADEEYLRSGVLNLIKDNLRKCDYSPEVMASIDQIIEIFWDRKESSVRSFNEISTGLDEMTELSFSHRLQLKGGAMVDANFTLGALKTHSCRAFLQWQIELGATRLELLQVIEELKRDP